MNNEPSLNVALDLEMLEKEIQSKEQNRSTAYNDLSGSIGGAATSRRTAHSSDPVDAGADFDTLDEPVMITIKRDARLIGAKFVQVLMPPKNQNCLQDWDLWGPLFVCVILSLLLQDTYTGKGPRFTEAFTLVFFGACVVTANIKLLGGKISFFQSLCVIGYCLLPSVFSSIACHLFHLESAKKLSMFLRLLCSALGFGWSTYASTAFLSSAQPEGRRFLSMYPMFLFYFIVAWLVFSNS
ncbi:Protein YIPF [Aphelenchoides fujianensis]|nr:Protein YIPF [Aphelenchoides fujianensis]